MKKITFLLLLSVSLLTQAIELQEGESQKLKKLPLDIQNQVKLVDSNSIVEVNGDLELGRYVQLSVKDNQFKVESCNGDKSCKTTHQINVIEINKLIDVYNEATVGPHGTAFALPTIPIAFGVGIGLCFIIKKCGEPGLVGTAVVAGTAITGMTVGIGAYIGLQMLFAEDASILDNVHLRRIFIPTQEGELKALKSRDLNAVLTSFSDLELYIDEHVE